MSPAPSVETDLTGNLGNIGSAAQTLRPAEGQLSSAVGAQSRSRWSAELATQAGLTGPSASEPEQEASSSSAKDLFAEPNSWPGLSLEAWTSGTQSGPSPARFSVESSAEAQAVNQDGKPTPAGQMAAASGGVGPVVGGHGSVVASSIKDQVQTGFRAQPGSQATGTALKRASSNSSAVAQSVVPRQKSGAEPAASGGVGSPPVVRILHGQILPDPPSQLRHSESRGILPQFVLAGAQAPGQTTSVAGSFLATQSLQNGLHENGVPTTGTAHGALAYALPSLQAGSSSPTSLAMLNSGVAPHENSQAESLQKSSLSHEQVVRTGRASQGPASQGPASQSRASEASLAATAAFPADTADSSREAFETAALSSVSSYPTAQRLPAAARSVSLPGSLDVMPSSTVASPSIEGASPLAPSRLSSAARPGEEDYDISSPARTATAVRAGAGASTTSMASGSAAVLKTAVRASGGPSLSGSGGGLSAVPAGVSSDELPAQPGLSHTPESTAIGGRGGHNGIAESGRSPFQALDSLDVSDVENGLNGPRVGYQNVAGNSPSVGGVNGVRALEIGYQDPALGYVELRAHAAGGGIHASLTAQSADSGTVLEAHLSSLASWMTERRTPVASLSVSSPLQDHVGDRGSSGHEQGNSQRDTQGKAQAMDSGERYRSLTGSAGGTSTSATGSSSRQSVASVADSGGSGAFALAASRMDEWADDSHTEWEHSGSSISLLA